MHKLHTLNPLSVGRQTWRTWWNNLYATVPVNCCWHFLQHLLCIPSFSQHFGFQTGKVQWEAGVNFGPTFSLAILVAMRGYGTKFIKDVNLELTKMMKGVFITALSKQVAGYKGGRYQYTYVEGRDNIINTYGVNELWKTETSTLKKGYLGNYMVL